jgi:hypothetical protein
MSTAAACGCHQASPTTSSAGASSRATDRCTRQRGRQDGASSSQGATGSGCSTSRTNKQRAVDHYSAFYLSTNGQCYWSDTLQLSDAYVKGYHRSLDRQLETRERASEVITELFVPRSLVTRFLDDVRQDFRNQDVNLIYGTIRLIERDAESFLAWAREPYACVIFSTPCIVRLGWSGPLEPSGA